MASTATIHQRFSWPLFASSSQVTLRRSFIGNGSCLGIRATQLNLHLSLSLHHVGDSKQSSWPIAAVGSGLEASITDSEKNDDIKLGNVDIVVESRDDDKICLRVDLAGEETQKVFDDVPKSFLLQILGEDRVTKFVIQEIVSVSVADYVKKEKLKVKNNFKTIQTAEELESAFTPGNEFGFNATMKFEKTEPEPEADSSSS
ncbi:hypothetical protein QJS10_CPB04g01885 [Acorus calamus]|uniref:Trigger factor ribosome-binding bacterial domain-containing protein n=1 Tax=Acorus calamus TaxID=4465 RepID=A0AAV9F116_ACOCL|nr:hypothetical protein QJS10_CPB04g01885 [Acorus calamus]